MFHIVVDIFSKNWIGSLISVFGILIGLFLYFKSKQKPILVFQHRGLRLLGHTAGLLPDDIEVLYKGIKISRLTKTVFIIWNCGEKTIRRADIVSRDRLRVDLPEDCQLLSANLVKASRNVNNFLVLRSDEQDNSIIFEFDFLDQNDGAVIEILHTSTDPYISVIGTIMGLPSGIKNFGKIITGRKVFSFSPFKIVLPSRLFYIITTVAGTLMTLASLYFSKSAQTRPSDKYAFVVMGLLYLSMGLFGLWMGRRRYPRILHCDALD